MIKVHTKMNVYCGWMGSYKEPELLGVWRLCLLPTLLLSTFGNRRSIFKVFKVCLSSQSNWKFVEFWSIKRQTSKESIFIIYYSKAVFIVGKELE